MAKDEIVRTNVGAAENVAVNVNKKSESEALLLKKKQVEVEAEKLAKGESQEEAVAAEAQAEVVAVVADASDVTGSVVDAGISPSVMLSGASGAGTTGGISNTTLLVGGGVLLAGGAIAIASNSGSDSDDDDTVTPPPTVVTVTSVVPAATTVAEGDAVTYTVKGTPGATVSFTVGGTATAADTTGARSGTIKFDDQGNATITVAAATDNVVDAGETIILTVGGVAAAAVTITDVNTNTGGIQLTAGTDAGAAFAGSLFTAGLVFNPGGTDRVNSLQDEDVLTGTGDNATLNATLGNANDNGGTTIAPTLNGIKSVNVAFTGSAGGSQQNAPVTALDLQDATGIQNLTVERISNGFGGTPVTFASILDAGTNNLTIRNVAVPTTVNFDYQEDALVGNNNTGALNLQGVTLSAVSLNNKAGLAPGNADLYGFENLTLTSTASANTLERLNATQLNKLTISGDKALTLANLTQEAERLTLGASAINNDGAGNYVLSSVDASALTAGLTIDLTNHLDAQPRPDNSGELVFLNAKTTGLADTIIFNQAVADSNITVDGGAGADTLKVYQSFTDDALTAARTSQVINVETLEVRSQAGANIAVDTQLIRDLDAILVRNENLANAPVTFRLNNLSAAAADATGAIEVRHGTTFNNGVLDTVVNAELKNGSGANDLVAVRIGTDLNTQNRFNFTINAFGEVATTPAPTATIARAQAVENLTILDSDNESNSIRINEVSPDQALQDNNGRGTLTISGGTAGHFLHLDSQRNAYGIAQDGSGASTFGRNTNQLNTNDSFANSGTRQDAGAQVGLNEGRLKFATIDARNEAADVILRVGREATGTESGAQNIMMGAGNDTVIFDVQNDATSAISAGLTRDDSVDGGAGNDILGIDGHGQAIRVGRSEWTNVKNFETIRLLGNGGVVDPVTGTNYTLVLTNELVDANQSAAGSGAVRIINDNDRANEGATTIAAGNSDRNAVAQGSVTIDATFLDSNRGFIYDGEETSAVNAGLAGSVAKTYTDDVFIVNDTINGRYVIDGGNNNRSDKANNYNGQFGRNNDVLEVRTAASGATTEVTIDDLNGIKNVGIIDFVNTTTQRASVVNTLNDTVVDNMVDSFQTNSTTTPYNETLVVRAFANDNVLSPAGAPLATTQLNLQAGQLSASKAVAILADRDTTIVTTGAGNDTIVLLGNFQNGAYAGVIDAATNTNIGLLSNSVAVPGQRALTAADTQINLGAGNDTVVTYGAINFAGLPVVVGNFLGVENLVSFSNITLTESQYRALTTLRFDGNAGHTLTIVSDGLSAGAIDLSKITVTNGQVLNIFNNSGDPLANNAVLLGGATVAINAGGSLSVTVAQAIANDYTTNNPVTVADTGANISTALANGQIAGNDLAQPLEVDFFDATDNTLTTTVAGVNAAKNARLNAGDVVTVEDSSVNIQALNAAQITAFTNVDVFRVAGLGTLTLNVQQVAAVGNNRLDAANNVVVSDTGAAITNNLGMIAFANVDRYDANNDLLTLNVAQLNTVTNNKLTGTDVVTVEDTGANIAALTAAQITALTNVDKFNAEPNVPGLTVSVAQAVAITGARFTDADVVTVRDTGANLAANVGGLGSNVNVDGDAVNVFINNGDKLDATDDLVSLTFAQLAALSDAQSAKFVSGDVLRFAATTGADGGINLGNAHELAGGVERVVYTAANQATTVLFGNNGNNNQLSNGDTLTLSNAAADVFTGFTTGTDKIDLSAFALLGQSVATQFTVNGSTVANGQYALIRGDLAGSIFTADNAAGQDTMLVWDGDTGAGVTQVAIVLDNTLATAADLLLV